MVSIKRLSSADKNFKAQLAQLTAFEGAQDESIDSTVAAICNDVKQRGDAAVIDYTAQFDGLRAASMADLQLSPSDLNGALASIPTAQREALETAAARIRAYHEKQKISSWQFTEADGTVLGQQVTALDRVGLYVPGGKAAYPSSLLMNVIPAKVAGVGEII